MVNVTKICWKLLVGAGKALQLLYTNNKMQHFSYKCVWPYVYHMKNGQHDLFCNLPYVRTFISNALDIRVQYVCVAVMTTQK